MNSRCSVSFQRSDSTHRFYNSITFLIFYPRLSCYFEIYEIQTKRNGKTFPNNRSIRRIVYRRLHACKCHETHAFHRVGKVEIVIIEIERRLRYLSEEAGKGGRESGGWLMMRWLAVGPIVVPAGPRNSAKYADLRIQMAAL